MAWFEQVNQEQDKMIGSLFTTGRYKVPYDMT